MIGGDGDTGGPVITPRAETSHSQTRPPAPGQVNQWASSNASRRPLETTERLDTNNGPKPPSQHFVRKLTVSPGRPRTTRAGPHFDRLSASESYAVFDVSSCSAASQCTSVSPGDLCAYSSYARAAMSSRDSAEGPAQAAAGPLAGARARRQRRPRSASRPRDRVSPARPGPSGSGNARDQHSGGATRSR